MQNFTEYSLDDGREVFHAWVQDGDNISNQHIFVKQTDGSYLKVDRV